MNDALAPLWPLPYLGSALRSMRDRGREGMLPGCPASSHMLVSKIKPCMSYTCNKPQLLEGKHLLDKRSMRALPVAMMIHDNSIDRTAFVPATYHSNFCPINF
ncbi:hypothetical protein V6N13_082042 [Hibiscus sabdariffa]